MSNKHIGIEIRDKVQQYQYENAIYYKDELLKTWVGISWIDFGKTTQNLSKALLNFGIKEQQNLGIFSENSPEWIIADIAIMSIRAVTVPIYATNSKNEVEYIINDSEISVIFVGCQQEYDKALEILESNNYLKLIVALSKDVNLQNNKNSIHYRLRRLSADRQARNNIWFRHSKSLKIFFFATILLNTYIIQGQDQTNSVVDDKALIEEAIKIEASSANAAANRQSYIDNMDSEIITLIADIQFLSQQLDLTNIYNRQMQELINSQNNEITSINEQMVELDNTNRGILPKLEEMVLTLESIIQNDIPFLLDERFARIQDLKNILLQSNISTSEKFRRVFEAYQIENEYGRTIESYRDEIDVDGIKYNVEIFRLGRVGLYARTSDGRYNAMFSKKQNQWIKQRGIDNELVIALKIARKELPPSLLKLPVEKI